MYFRGIPVPAQAQAVAQHGVSQSRLPSPQFNPPGRVQHPRFPHPRRSPHKTTFRLLPQKSSTHTRAVRSAPPKPLTFPAARARAFHRAHRPHHCHHLSRRRSGRHGGRRLLAGGRQAPRAQARSVVALTFLVRFLGLFRYLLHSFVFGFFCWFCGWIDARQAQGFISFFKKLPQVRLPRFIFFSLEFWGLFYFWIIVS